MKPPIRTILAVLAAALSATLAYSQSTPREEHVGVNAERGDPARWYIPADTPQLKYETQVKEAGAARAEALKECRAMKAGRSSCVDEANAQYRHDMEEARRAKARSESSKP